MYGCYKELRQLLHESCSSLEAVPPWQVPNLIGLVGTAADEGWPTHMRQGEETASTGAADPDTDICSPLATDVHLHTSSLAGGGIILWFASGSKRSWAGSAGNRISLGTTWLGFLCILPQSFLHPFLRHITAQLYRSFKELGWQIFTHRQMKYIKSEGKTRRGGNLSDLPFTPAPQPLWQKCPSDRKSVQEAHTLLALRACLLEGNISALFTRNVYLSAVLGARKLESKEESDPFWRWLVTDTCALHFLFWDFHFPLFLSELWWITVKSSSF